MLLKKGSKGSEVLQLQKKLNQYFKKKTGSAYKPIGEDGDFGGGTEQAVVQFQKNEGLKPDGLVGDITWGTLQKLTSTEATPPSDTSQTPPKDTTQASVPSGDPKAPYKDVVIQGSTFPGAPYKWDVKITFTKELINEYQPALVQAIPDASKGLKLLITIMAHKEGFYAGTRSYKNNNPGNIGNTDSGANNKLASLKDGILLQKSYVERVANGQHPAYPMNKQVNIKPYYSPEIAKNQKVYGLNPYLPGYNFVFTGQLDQYVKIYSTGARGGNSYLNMIMSYFKNHGIDLKPESKIQDIIKIN